ncbi:diguanylate cyclase [Aggregicoccus sp. 17bor-14]|uniref:sensor domain-containing diguanylate cyclase n=1 Tax=Myxococcaceae TaxID=31 RepID=UPI00129D200F|nr:MULTISPECIES: diguanylate cyclase [Myxococcaceae]MBF5040822.1 diguanylate cyclase [Simulacricoccus sp. 17bor-14]MRI86611.1 diguanylate cyclase [Aggregicoccus sp. 17bor-14]
MATSSAVSRLSKLVRTGVRSIPGLSALAAFAHLGRGGFRGFSTLEWMEAGLVAFLLAGLAITASRRVSRGAVGATVSFRDDVELGGPLIAASFIVVAIGGGELFPIVYLLMAFLVAFLPRNSGLALLGVAAVGDALVTLGGDERNLTAFATHTVFLALFAGLYHLVLSARIAAARRAEHDAVKNRIKEVEDRARTFRLVSSGTQDNTTGIEDQEKWVLASVKQVESTVREALEIAETALRTHTCAAFMLTSDDRGLKMQDAASASEHLHRERFAAGEGILGGVLKRKAPVRMCAAGGLKGVSYYEEGASEIRAVLAVPIVEGGGAVRGVLVADRLMAEPFSEQDERILVAIATAVLRSMEVERVMTDIRKQRDDNKKFRTAIEELNRVAKEQDVTEAVVENARVLAELDFCALTLVSEESGARMHRVVRVTGTTTSGKALEGKTFADNAGLVSNVVRYAAPLPGRDLKSMGTPVIFDEDTQVRGLAALKIFPLNADGRILGTLVAGSRRRAAFDQEVIRNLEVVALQAAQALNRAELYKAMERMATTDGLTGLFNHRTFQSKADEALAQAKRYGRKCSVILTDIDHFKSVNDTYGHPTGDAVLRNVAKILREKARDTDVVARYGGEEFAIIMPETDARGAQVIAERIREAVRAETFATEIGPLKITLSLGIATCPDSGTEKQALIDLADQCLYHAKRNGRNQSVTVAQMQGGRKLHAVEG